MRLYRKTNKPSSYLYSTYNEFKTDWFFLQIAAAVSVSTGCISYGICIAYTSPAIPSILAKNQTNSLTNILGDEEISYMSKICFYTKLKFIFNPTYLYKISRFLERDFYH